jgi:hypothetical protein
MTARSAKRTAGLLALAAALCFALMAPASGAPRIDRSGFFLVPTVSQRAEFGAFRQGPHAAARLRRALGTPTEEKAGAFGNCRMTWERIGVAVELNAPERARHVCAAASFGFARLTDPRWHTASGVHPGSTRAAAERVSVLRCHASSVSCDATGYALGLYRDCSGHLFTSVIAHPRGNKIIALNVDGRRICR